MIVQNKVEVNSGLKAQNQHPKAILVVKSSIIGFYLYICIKILKIMKIIFSLI